MEFALDSLPDEHLPRRGLFQFHTGGIHAAGGIGRAKNIDIISDPVPASKSARLIRIVEILMDGA
jgi:hypothetical protein